MCTLTRAIIWGLNFFMFETLTQRLTTVFDKLRGRGLLSEDDVNAAMRDVRIALLEADVALPVVKKLVEDIRQKAIGQEVLRSISPGQMVVKIVHEHLITTLGDRVPINLAAPAPFSILMVGLQGSGKTTSTAKLALYLQEKEHKKVLMVSLDIYRPAAQHQLEILGQSLAIATLPIIEGQKPADITKRSLDEAKKLGVDVILFDTAGRLHIDDTLMDEVVHIQKLTNPLETLLVADAMTGQDAVHMATGFQQRLSLTGLILTRVDGDSRGGAALSMRSVTGCPIKFMGIGEKPNEFEVFDPKRIADRILDMGDILSLVERAQEVMQDEDAEKLAKKFEKGHFDLNDMAKHLEQMLKMGGVSGLLSYLPGVGKIKDQLQNAGIDDRMLRRQIAVIHSMTKQERKTPNILNASRRKRIAAGCGQMVSDVNKVIKQFEQMQTMMKRMGKLGQKGFLRSGMGSLFGR
jgi:signal recognition particle subunit SRP54